MSEFLESVVKGRVLKLWLNRPEKRNALNAALCRELAGTLEDAGRDRAIGAIVLGGRGKSFSAGMDLAEVATAVPDELNLVHEQLFTIGSRLEKPLVVAVEGPALGGGTGLVANGHIVIAGEEATFGLTEIRLGLWPFLVYRAVANAMGDRRTLELALTGRIFGAPEAEQLGLVHEVADSAEERALAVAEAVAGWSPMAVRNGMAFVHQARGEDWHTAGEIARRMRDDVLAGPDFQEGVRAFREKRSPRWPSLE